MLAKIERIETARTHIAGTNTMQISQSEIPPDSITTKKIKFSQKSQREVR